MTKRESYSAACEAATSKPIYFETASFSRPVPILEVAALAATLLLLKGGLY
jgi:hypothetical protein